MHLLKNNHQQSAKEGSSFIQHLKHERCKLSPEEIQVGSYYIYKEKHGIVALVKVIEETSKHDWVGFILQVKRIFHSHWPVPKGSSFEVGYNSLLFEHPSAWHIEPCMTLINCDDYTRTA